MKIHYLCCKSINLSLKYLLSLPFFLFLCWKMYSLQRIILHSLQ
ncbi:hypothetical protein HMPREF9999_00408 [Alloprevotella sp. oral taxon 473 str. F0040]|nr:hypothetical protein HMPREF9999_00408 [Alloprevotella sp. oral taxon 473 str. F0040]